MLVGIVVFILLLALVCASIAADRGENPRAGFVLGLILGPFAPKAIHDQSGTADHEHNPQEGKADPLA